MFLGFRMNMAKVPNIFRFVKRGRGYFYYELVTLGYGSSVLNYELRIMNYEQSCKREQNQVYLDYAECSRLKAKPIMN